jgi:hypothetical protein
MKTAMQELRDDLVMTLKTGNEALNEIKDKSIRESCQKVVQLTLESIIKRIDEELLEMEKEQIKDAYLNGRYEADKIVMGHSFYAKQYYNETFKQQEQ